MLKPHLTICTRLLVTDKYPVSTTTCFCYCEYMHIVSRFGHSWDMMIFLFLSVVFLLFHVSTVFVSCGVCKSTNELFLVPWCPDFTVHCVDLCVFFSISQPLSVIYQFDLLSSSYQQKLKTKMLPPHLDFHFSVQIILTLFIIMFFCFIDSLTQLKLRKHLPT